MSINTDMTAFSGEINWDGAVDTNNAYQKMFFGMMVQLEGTKTESYMGTVTRNQQTTAAKCLQTSNIKQT